jgi:hypothetical protein
VMRHTLMCLLSAVALGGCLSLQAVRANSPSRTGDASGHYLALAECLVTRAKQEHQSRIVSYEMEDFPAARTARVVATARYPGGIFYTVPTALVELTFREPDEGNVKIEARRGPLGARHEPRMWSMVGGCALGKMTVSPVRRDKIVERASPFMVRSR